ncbi:hypothetical protein D3C75_439510 [compost metagenome]
MIHINGGSGDPNGYDIQNGVIVAIGSNVHVWLTPDSPDGKIQGDFVPKSASPDQIHYYTSSGNANAGESSKGHTDIFVVGDHTGGYYQQGDWSNDRYEFKPLNGITGNQGLPEGDAGKDYIFVQGDAKDYTVTGVDHPQNHQNNDIDNLHVYENGTWNGPFQNANGIEGVVFGDGPSSSLGGNTTSSTRVTLNLDVNLESSDSSDHLNSITLSGIPEGATFTGNHVNATYDAVNKVYVLTFDNDTTHYTGQVSAEFPGAKGDFDDITLKVDSTASDHHDTDFTFDGEKGGTVVSEHHAGDSAVDHDDDNALTASHSDDDNQTDNHSAARMASQGDDDKLTHAGAQSEESDHNADHTADTGDHSASLIDDDNLMFSTTAADTEQSHADIQTAQAYSASSTLSGEEQDQQLHFNDIIHDEEHNDLSSLIQAGPQSESADGPAEIAHVPAEGGETVGADSYDAGHEAMLDSLIAKPEEVS